MSREQGAAAFRSWREAHKGLWQFVLFILMSGITTVVDLSTFAVLNFWVFAAYRSEAFALGPIRYSAASGGLCAFLAFAVSFAVSQTLNFFLQRKTTFQANNNAVLSGVLYALMVVGVYFLQLYLPTLLSAPFASLIGVTAGGLAVKLVNMFVSMLIQFPMSKWVIMRKR